MNYATDRLDRKGRRGGGRGQAGRGRGRGVRRSDDGAEGGSAAAPAAEGEGDDGTDVDGGVDDPLWDDYGRGVEECRRHFCGATKCDDNANRDVPTVWERRQDRNKLEIAVAASRGHSLLGRTLRDVGWNRRALYHFGQAWILLEEAAMEMEMDRDDEEGEDDDDEGKGDDDPPVAPGDVDDEEDECDLSEIEAAAADYAQMCELAGYVEVGVLAAFAYRLMIQKKKRGRSGLLVRSEGRPGSDRPSPVSREEFWRRVQHRGEGETDDPCDGANGDGDGDHHCGCGYEGCGSSPCFIPMADAVVDPVLDAFRTYLVDGESAEEAAMSAMSRRGNDGRRQQQQQQPTANELLGRFAAPANSSRPNKKGQSTNSGAAAATSAPDPSTLWQQNEAIPRLLQFWVADDEDDGESRNLSPVTQLMLLKLLYLTVPSLACRALAAMEEEKMAALTPTSRTFKSHHAYYVLIRAVVLGERIKPSRRFSVPDYHVPVWDLVHGLDRRRDYSPSSPSSRTGTSRAAKSDAAQTPYPQLADASTWVDRVRELVAALASPSRTPKLEMEPPLPFCWAIPEALLRQAEGLLYLVGDSHVLSLAWQCVQLPTSEKSASGGGRADGATYRRLLVVPVVVTGLKAWHCRSATRFFTRTCLAATVLRRRLLFAGTIVLSAGEIDCREGLGGPRLAGYRESCLDAVERTVQDFVGAIQQLLLLRDGDAARAMGGSLRQVLVMPVAPHAHQSAGRAIGRAARRETMKEWNRQLKLKLQGKDGLFFLDYVDHLTTRQPQNGSTENEASSFVLEPALNADGTHLNAAFAKHFEHAITTCGCSLDLI